MAGRGDFDKLVEFQRQTTIKSRLGPEKSGGWGLVQKAWAKVSFGTGQERREAATQGASQAATFRVLATPALRTVTANDCQILWDGQAWDITGWVTFKRSHLDFTAVAAKG